MKVVINCNEFKKAVDRVLAVVPQKPSIEVLKAVKLEANSDKLIISGTDIVGFVKVYIDAQVIESGVSYILYEDIKKVYKLDGMVTLDSDSESNHRCTVSNHKKKSTVTTRDFAGCEYEYPTDTDRAAMEISERELVHALADIGTFIDPNCNNVAMESYFFDGMNDRIVGLNGHCLGIKRIAGVFKKDCKLVIPCTIYPHLKKIANVKSDKVVKVSYNTKYVQFSGEDFDYWSRLSDCEYYKVDSLLNINDDFEFKLEPEEIVKLSKEYKSVLSATDNNPMFVVYDDNNKSINTGVITPDYMTSDLVDGFKNVHGLDKTVVFGFNPRYIYDAMQLFSDEVNVKGMFRTSGVTGAQTSPLIFFDNVYTALVLPVNVAKEKIEQFKSYINVA